jgi:catechol 2,3-dioxygenase-like lactoylglutathione lyase family enzyme
MASYGLYDKGTIVMIARMTKSALSSAKLCGFVATRDRAKAKAFYQDVLGLKLISDDQFAIVFEMNGNHLRVTPVREHAPAPYTVLGWEVHDIEGSVDALIKAGAKFEKYDFLQQDARGIWTAPGGAKVAWFKDPDDNVLSLAQH